MELITHCGAIESKTFLRVESQYIHINFQPKILMIVSTSTNRSFYFTLYLVLKIFQSKQADFFLKAKFYLKKEIIMKC